MSQSPYIVEVTEQNVHEVLAYSRQIPVLLDFWSSRSQACQALMPVLEKLVNEYRGRFVLGMVNSDEQQMLASQLGVRSLPTLKLVFQGQLAGELLGLQPEAQIRALLDQFVGMQDGEEEEPEQEEPAADDFLGQIARARATGRHEDAIEALHAALKEAPEKHEYQIVLADIYFDKAWYDEAQGVIENIPEKTEGLATLKARLYFARESEQGPAIDALQAQLEKQPENVELLYFLACHSVVKGDVDAALELFLDVLRRDRSIRDDGARRALLSLFDLLGKDDPRVTQYRRRMFNFMH